MAVWGAGDQVGSSGGPPEEEEEGGEWLTVVVGDSSFSAEKSLLLRHCGYFQALFRSGMRDSRQTQVHLSNLCARSFQLALRVFRGDRPLILDPDHIQESIECAAFLQAASLSCHLSDLLDSSNCLLMFHGADAYGLADLAAAAALFIRDVYRDLEAELRETLPPELVSRVEALPPSVLVAVGAHAPCSAGASGHAASRTLCYLDEEQDVWKELTALPLQASTSMAGVAVLDNRLYVVGGVQGIRKQPMDQSFCYSVEEDAWSPIDSPVQPRYNFPLVGLDGRLLAIGGESGNTAMSSVETFHVGAGTWTFSAHLPRPAAGAACAKTLGRVFVCLWRPMETTEIWEHSAGGGGGACGGGAWTLVATLIRQQSYGHALVGHGDRLYVVRNGPSDDFLRCLLDCYSLSTGQWSALPGHYPNSKGALFTAVVRGDGVLTLSRSATQEYGLQDGTWRPRRQGKGFPRSGSLWTFLLRLPSAP
ncbi:kelch repeat and BTB domain-containing protein 13-like [Gadus morhua]|uniref:Kelch repeat and BTB domain-containing protein 13-like n=1 Tax=Gadus morhua TaxID=8049 RepID=A0A8C4ZV94_GADMO|nr:kelch repeat and BTB domain-containing protein 13-like [Gadus morhua]